MRHLFLAAALLAAVPAAAYEAPYPLAPGNYIAHSHAARLAAAIGRREMLLSACPNVVRSSTYGGLERALYRIEGLDREAARAYVAQKIAMARANPITTYCDGGPKVLGSELSERPAPRPRGGSIQAMVCRGEIPESQNTKRDAESCWPYR